MPNRETNNAKHNHCPDVLGCNEWALYVFLSRTTLPFPFSAAVPAFPPPGVTMAQVPSLGIGLSVPCHLGGLGASTPRAARRSSRLVGGWQAPDQALGTPVAGSSLPSSRSERNQLKASPTR